MSQLAVLGAYKEDTEDFCVEFDALGYELFVPKSIQELEDAYFEARVSSIFLVTKGLKEDSVWYQFLENKMNIPIVFFGENFPDIFLNHYTLHFVDCSYSDEKLAEILEFFKRQELELKNKILSAFLEVQSLAQKEFQSLYFHDFIASTLHLLADLVGAQNVLWLELSEFEHYMNEMWKIRSIDSSHRNRGRGIDRKGVPSIQPISVSELSEQIRELNSADEQAWESAETPLCLYTDKEKFILFPILYKGEILGQFMIVNPTQWDSPFHLKLFECLQDFFNFSYSASVKYSKERDLTFIDDLTELYNQRYLATALDQSIERAQYKSSCFSVLFMDIDHFKKVNDNKGHIIGSKILIELGKIIKQNIRNIDYGFRYGGDEYLIILTDSDASIAQTVAERIRKQVEDTTFELADRKVKITLSIGIACYPEHAKTKEDVIELADQAMYYGKNKSRNIVFIAS